MGAVSSAVACQYYRILQSTGWKDVPEMTHYVSRRADVD